MQTPDTVNTPGTPNTEDAPLGVTVELQPEGRTVTLTNVKSVVKLLRKLDKRQGSVLVIRDGGLLTPDVPLKVGDRLIVRTVISQG